MDFEQAFARTLGHEGTYANDPRDPGGETMWGITAASARAAGYAGEMRSMPLATAREIYRRHYWGPAGCEAVPVALRADLFDAAVNAGVRQAIRLLQRAVGVVDDGVLGSITLQAINSMPPARLVARFNGVRLDHLTSLPAWNAFGRGWARRLAANLMEA